MDRRQRKTRDAVFAAFAELLATEDFHHITVGDIIDRADIGRATFYSHFESKDLLLWAYCKELFCHIFDTEDGNAHGHRHIFDCDSSESAFLHLFRHLQQNDNHILSLLSSRNNELFLRYFRDELALLIDKQSDLLRPRHDDGLPDSFWKYHVVRTFTDTLEWWIANGMTESPETITRYFLAVL